MQKFHLAPTAGAQRYVSIFEIEGPTCIQECHRSPFVGLPRGGAFLKAQYLERWACSILIYLRNTNTFKDIRMPKTLGFVLGFLAQAPQFCNRPLQVPET